MIKSHSARLVLLGVCCIGFSTPAIAEDTWRVQFTPYVWGASMAGDIRPLPHGPTISTRQSFSEIMKNLEAALFVNATARRDRLVLFGDLTHASLSDSESPAGIPVTGRLRQSSFTAAAGYQVVSEEDLGIDLLLGARFWHIRAKVSTPAPLPIQSVSKTESWTDPILAARMNARLNPDWSFILYGDIGGFGAGSEKTWQWVGTLNYQLRDDLYISGGYRHLKVDYDDGRTRVDVDMSGPLVGMTWRF